MILEKDGPRYELGKELAADPNYRMFIKMLQADDFSQFPKNTWVVIGPDGLLTSAPSYDEVLENISDLGLEHSNIFVDVVNVQIVPALR